MSDTKLVIKKAAVLGAGVMGAQIAALLTNAGVKTVLFDLPAQQEPKNATVHTALQRLKKLKPSPLAIPEQVAFIDAANYEDDLEVLSQCDLIIEAIAERLSLKQDLYHKIQDYIREDAIFVTNTSGLSIATLCESLPEALRTQFLGAHFFNPPRYMRLVEMIPTQQTSDQILTQLESFLVSTLGKGVVYAKDTPNFIANRIGVFSMLAIMHHAKRFDIPFEVVDGLTGPLIGRPKSATFRTADVVGLDTFAHVVATMDEYLPDDPWHSYYKMPQWFLELINQGALGQKSGAGIYKKQGKDILVWDLTQQNYRAQAHSVAEEVNQILKIKNPKEKFAALQHSEHPQAKFLWACFQDVFHYSAYHLQSIADTVRDADLALRLGFGWKQGVFETWQSAGWQSIKAQLDKAIDAKLTLADVSLPNWVHNIKKVYQPEGAYAPESNSYKQRSDLPVYKRQLFFEPMLEEHFDEGQTIFENDSFRFWHQGDDIAIASFKTKGNTIDDLVLSGIMQAVDLVEKKYKGMIIWPRHGNDFSFGANLKMLVEVVQQKGPQAAAKIIENFQKASLKLRYCQKPTIAALKGRVLGGGCELSMHCDKIVAAFETYMGLVEIGVGLLPAGGGTKEFALRASVCHQKQQNLTKVTEGFKTIATAAVSSSAMDAFGKGFLKSTDVTVMNPDEILYVAKQQIVAMYESGYRAPIKTTFAVSGKAGLGAIKALLANYQAGQFISEYDQYLCEKIAEVFCGGEVDEGTPVDEEYLLKLERDIFVEFLLQPNTQQRIAHTLKTGKPLRN